MTMPIKKFVPRRIKILLKKYLGGEARNSDVIPQIKKHLHREGITVLDVGCGRPWDGNPHTEDILFSVFADLRHKITGIDIFEDCVAWRTQHGPAGIYMVLDARMLDTIPETFDIIIAHHVLEHLEKRESIQVLEMIERKAKKQIIIGTPIGFTCTDYNEPLHQNAHERHLCGWQADEFRARGYRVIRIKNVLLAIKNIV